MKRGNALSMGYQDPMDPAATGVPQYDTDTGKYKVIDRLNVLPLGLYDDGSITLAMPGFLNAPYEAKQRLGHAASQPGFRPADHAIDAFSVASSLPLGSVASSIPANGVASNALRRGRPPVSLTPADEQFIVQNYYKLGRDELMEKLGYNPRVVYRELPDILERNGLEMKQQGSFGLTPSQIAARNAEREARLANAPPSAPRHTRDPGLVDFIAEGRNPVRADGQMSMGQIANAWNERPGVSPITRSTVAGIRRDFNLPVNVMDPTTALTLSALNASGQPSNALARY